MDETIRIRDLNLQLIYLKPTLKRNREKAVHIRLKAIASLALFGAALCGWMASLPAPVDFLIIQIGSFSAAWLFIVTPVELVKNFRSWRYLTDLAREYGRKDLLT